MEDEVQEGIDDIEQVELYELSKDYDKLNTNIWLEKNNINPLEYWSAHAKYYFSDSMHEQLKSEWRQKSNEQYQGRTLYCSVDESYIDDETKEFVFGFDLYESDMVDQYIKPEDSYLETVRQSEIKELFSEILDICTDAEKIILQALLEYIPQFCADDCPKLNICDLPDFSAVCKRHLKGNRWIRNIEVAQNLGVDKSAVTNSLKRLKTKIIKQLGVTKQQLIDLGIADSINKHKKPIVKRLGDTITIGIMTRIRLWHNHCDKFDDLKLSFKTNTTVCNWCHKCTVAENRKHQEYLIAN